MENDGQQKEEIYGGLRPTNLTDGGNHGTLIRGRLERGNNTTVNLIDATLKSNVNQTVG